jgi:hypothetical protein
MTALPTVNGFTPANSWHGDGNVKVTLANAQVIGGYGDIDFEESSTYRDLLNCQNTPNPTKQLVMTRAKFTINLDQLDKGTGITISPLVDPSSGTECLMVINATGFYFSGNVLISNMKGKVGPEPTKAASGSFEAESIGSNIAFDASGTNSYTMHLSVS